MSVENKWNDTDRGTLKYPEKTPFLCHFDDHKSHRHWPGIGLRACRPASVMA